MKKPLAKMTSEELRSLALAPGPRNESDNDFSKVILLAAISQTLDAIFHLLWKGSNGDQVN